MPMCDSCGWRGGVDQLVEVDEDGAVEGDDEFDSGGALSFCPECGSLVEEE